MGNPLLISFNVSFFMKIYFILHVIKTEFSSDIFFLQDKYI